MLSQINLSEQCAIYRLRTENTLNQVLSVSNSFSDRLVQAMRYTMLGGGKRLRPILVYATGECFGQSLENLDLIAASVECIHGYSLIHDDLPVMDNDNLRRGKPTCHIAFDEATAILAGDALQNLAFELIATSKMSSDIRIRLIETLASKCGTQGMVSGQMLDLQAEGRRISLRELENIHALKTGALIRASVRMGAIAAGLTVNTQNEFILNQLDIFSQSIGLAFQLQDDLLDIIGEQKNTGKTTGQDIKLQKSTYAILMGMTATQEKIKTLTKQAIIALQMIPFDTTLLKMIANMLVTRNA